MSDAKEKPKTIAVKFFGGSLHGNVENFMTFGAVPQTIMVPVWGTRNEKSVLREAPLIGREMYGRACGRDRELDEGVELAYLWESNEGAKRVPSEGKRRR